MESLKIEDCRDKLKKYHQTTLILRFMKYTKFKPLKTFNKRKSFFQTMLSNKSRSTNNSYKHSIKIIVKLLPKETLSKKCGNLQLLSWELLKCVRKLKTSLNYKFTSRKSDTEKTWENWEIVGLLNIRKNK